MSRTIRKPVKRIIVLLIILGLIFGCYFYSKEIATKRVTTKNYNYQSTTIPSEFDGFKIGFISDIYIKDAEDIKHLESIVETLNQSKCDMIIFGGDLFESEIIEQETVISILKKADATYGKFAVLGEKDFINLDTTISILENSGFEVLRNAQRNIYYNNASISLLGLESNTDLSPFNSDKITLAIIHEPDYFNELKNTFIGLQISGHTNGGYIYLPYIKALNTVNQGKLYNHGRYTENDSTLLVSNGLGMESGHEYRFFCPMQIVVVTLKSLSTQ